MNLRGVDPSWIVRQVPAGPVSAWATWWFRQPDRAAWA